MAPSAAITDAAAARIARHQVSVASGVANIASGIGQFFPSFPEIDDNERTIAALLLLAGMWYVNKRGIKEASRAFSIPTYFFLGSVGLLLASGVYQWATGSLEQVRDVGDVVEPMQAMTSDAELSFTPYLRS